MDCKAEMFIYMVVKVCDNSKVEVFICVKVEVWDSSNVEVLVDNPSTFTHME
jgi:hypothetical protein